MSKRTRDRGRPGPSRRPYRISVDLGPAHAAMLDALAEKLSGSRHGAGSVTTTQAVCSAIELACTTLRIEPPTAKEQP